jgi:hypothetical protein
MAWKGKYKVKNPHKYKGDPTKVTYRSSLELKFMNFLDNHPDILEWNSEEVIIPYLCPTDRKYHRYFVDFWMKRKNAAGKIETFLIEVKPKSQTKPPVKKSKVTRRYLTEVMTWGKNQAKWEAATEYCIDRGWQFKIITEKEING